MQQLMKQAQKMQQQMAEAQQQLASTELTGTAGGGLVTATVSGTGELLGVKIDPKAVDADDVESLEDLVVAAVRDGQRQAAELGESAMAPVSGGARRPPAAGLLRGVRGRCPGPDRRARATARRRAQERPADRLPPAVRGPGRRAAVW